MPASVRRRTIIERCRYTGERHSQAAPAVRGSDHGLDRCTPSQQRFRANLALLLLNSGAQVVDADPYLDALIPGRPFLADWGVGRLLSYTMTLSAWRDELVIVSEMHDHLMAPMRPRADRRGPNGIPGLRPLDRHPDDHWFRWKHLPTGAILRFQGVGPILQWGKGPEGEYLWSTALRTTQLDETEALAANCVPRMHHDAETLLAALVVRLTSADPDGQWAVHSLVWSRYKKYASTGSTGIHLWGKDTDWTLSWGGQCCVPTEHLGHALAGSPIGLSGATFDTASDGVTTVRYGAARLVLIAHTDHYARAETERRDARLRSKLSRGKRSSRNR